MSEGYFDAYSSDLADIPGWPAYTRAVCEAELANDSSAFHEEAEELRDSLSDNDEDKLDLENCEVVSYSEEHITLSGGGDWQSPVEFTIREVDGELRVTEAKYFQFFCTSPANTEQLEQWLADE